MNIVKLFRSIEQDLNEDQKCGFCWEFSAPFFEDIANTIIESEPCCVQLRLIDYSQNKVNTYVNGFPSNNYVDYNFTLQAIKQSELGRNMDNEQKIHPLDQSKWELIYNPLRECLSDDQFVKWCEYLGLQVEVTRWNFTMLVNYSDNNYDGWKIQASIRIRNEF